MRAALLLVLMLLGGTMRGDAPDAAELTRLLQEFLAGASTNDAAVHDRFWADDLIYTGSSGRRVGKADILRDMRSAPAKKAGDPSTIYTAEDVRIQQYGTTAVVAFRLVGTTTADGRTEVQKFLNSGTFLKREGRWQVVNWQATRLPDAATPDAARAAENAAEEAAIVAAIDRAYVQGVHAKFDPSAMRAGMHESFVMFVQSDSGVTQTTRDAWIERMSNAKPRPEGEPAPAVRGDIKVLDRDGNAAVARVHLFRDGKQVFTDYVSLYKLADGWKLVGKTFVRK